MNIRFVSGEVSSTSQHPPVATFALCWRISTVACSFSRVSIKKRKRKTRQASNPFQSAHCAREARRNRNVPPSTTFAPVGLRAACSVCALAKALTSVRSSLRSRRTHVSCTGTLTLRATSLAVSINVRSQTKGHHG